MRSECPGQCTAENYWNKVGAILGGSEYIKYDNMLSMPTLLWITCGSAPLIHNKVGSFAYYPIHTVPQYNNLQLWTQISNQWNLQIICNWPYILTFTIYTSCARIIKHKNAIICTGPYGSFTYSTKICTLRIIPWPDKRQSKFKIPLWNYNSITIIQQHLIIMRHSCRHCQRIFFFAFSILEAKAKAEALTLVRKGLNLVKDQRWNHYSCPH